MKILPCPQQAAAFASLVTVLDDEMSAVIDLKINLYMSDLIF